MQHHSQNVIIDVIIKQQQLLLKQQPKAYVHEKTRPMKHRRDIY